MKAWFAKHMPAPMAAPETAELRAARIRLIVALVLLAAMSLFWSLIAGPLALGLLAGLAVFILVEGLFWLRAKNAADDAYLMSGLGSETVDDD